MYIEVLAKFGFGKDFVPLFKVEYNNIEKTFDQAKNEAIEYIRQYRAGNKSVEFKIVDNSGKKID